LSASLLIYSITIKLKVIDKVFPAGELAGTKGFDYNAVDEAVNGWKQDAGITHKEHIRR